MIEKLKKLIEKHPKHFNVLIKKDKELMDFVESSVPNQDISLAEKIYIASTGDTGVCPNGNTRKFVSVNKGRMNCGKATECQCTRESVSSSVSAKKAARTIEQIQEENKKREATSMTLYGVINNGQIEFARNQHREFYSNQQNVIDSVTKNKNTKLENHGDQNYNNRQKANSTMIEKYGVNNPNHLSSKGSNPNLDVLRDHEKFKELYPTKTVDQIATELGVHVQTVYRYLALHEMKTPFKSTFEVEIEQYLLGIGVDQSDIQTRKRKIIGKELDIYLPKYNLAIEYNGLIWHHDGLPHIDKTYHHTKFKKCEELGIKLLTIFEHSWKSHKDAWKEKIKHALGFQETKVFARKCKIVELSSSDTRDILDKHHIQGYCAAQVCYGLMDSHDNLMAAMTFSKPRNGIGKDRGEDSYELVRYVTACSVVGGASKLLKHFIKNHSPKTIVSYSDNQYSNGELYQILGFNLEKEHECGYWYYDPSKKNLYHRYNFTKHKLISAGCDQALTEKQIMDELGYLRIWDCGSKTWVLKL
jgi:hypothetical protein